MTRGPESEEQPARVSARTMRAKASDTWMRAEMANLLPEELLKENY